MTFFTVFTKATKRCEAVATKYEAEIYKQNGNDYITIRDTKRGFQNSFNVGDYAEYGSYNLSYYGPIIKITDKTVSIICRFDAAAHARGEKVKVHRLSLDTFCWRNIRFNLNDTIESNREISYHI